MSAPCRLSLDLLDGSATARPLQRGAAWTYESSPIRNFNPCSALCGTSLSPIGASRRPSALVEGRSHYGVELDAESLAPIGFDEVAGAVTDPHRRKRRVQLAIVTALVEGEPGALDQNAPFESWRLLEIDEQGLDVLHEMASGTALVARFDIGAPRGSLLEQLEWFPWCARSRAAHAGFR